MVPYTREALASLRDAASRGMPAEHIRQLFGWDSATLAQRCTRHEIKLLVLAPSPPTPRGNGPAALSAILAKLTSRQAQIFGVLHPRIDPAGQWSDRVSGAYIARMIGVEKPNAIIRSVVGLDIRLRKMGAPYRVESKLGRGGGFRLVIEEPAQ